MTTMAAPTYTTMAAAPTVMGTSIMAAPAAYTNYASSYAAPMTTTVAAAASYAAPVSYAAAPVSYAAPMTTTMAAPIAYAAPVSYAAPMTTTMAAPTSYAAPVSYAAPMTTTMAPSYVASPTYAMPQSIVAPAAPLAPMKLTEGIPTPEQIAAQKNGYAAALDKQLKEAIETVQKETAIEKEMIKFTSEKSLDILKMQVEEQLVTSLALADEQMAIRMLELKKALVERNLQLDSQASQLTMDYQMKSIQTECAQKRYEFDVKYVKAENSLAADYNKQVATANTGTTYRTA